MNQLDSEIKTDFETKIMESELLKTIVRNLIIEHNLTKVYIWSNLKKEIF